jgi:hypothetical protein
MPASIQIALLLGLPFDILKTLSGRFSIEEPIVRTLHKFGYDFAK